jgi:hypothetical protein
VIDVCKKAYQSFLHTFGHEAIPSTFKCRDIHGTVTINGQKRAGATVERPLGFLGYRQSSCFTPVAIDRFIPARFRRQVLAAQLQHTILITAAGSSWAVVLASFFTSKSHCLSSYSTVAKNPTFKAYIPISCVGPRVLLVRDFDDRTALVILPLPSRPR